MKRLILYLALAAECAAESAPSKSDYNLFNPTPEAQMREFVTDRPDKTEAPYTVDAGHFQHETDILSYVRNSVDGVTDQSLLLMSPNLKVGLTNSSDLQLVVQSFGYDRTEGNNGGSKKLSGFGDILVRFKQNIWGNDSGDSALAVMPYLKFPTNRGELGNTSL